MAKETLNYGLKKPDPEDFFNVEDMNGNMDVIDAALGNTAKFDIADGTATAISLTGISLLGGRSKTFIALADNASEDTRINDKPLYKPGTTTAPKLIKGKAYTIWYDATGDCFFIKASSEGSATPDKVLASETFSNEFETGLEGNIPVISTGSSLVAKDTTSVDGQLEFIVPSHNYFNGGSVIVNDPNYKSECIRGDISIFGLAGKKEVMDTTTQNDIATYEMLAGKEAFVNGIKKTGTMPVAPPYPNNNTAYALHAFADKSLANNVHNLFMVAPRGYYNYEWLGAYVPNLVPENIRSGVVIGGADHNITGTLVPGLQYASGGPITCSTSAKQFYYQTTSGSSYSQHYIQVTGLTFKPTMIIIMPEPADGYKPQYYSTTYLKNTKSPGFLTIRLGYMASVFSDADYGGSGINAYVNSTGFLLPVDTSFGSTNQQYHWVAINWPEI